MHRNVSLSTATLSYPRQRAGLYRNVVLFVVNQGLPDRRYAIGLQKEGVNNDETSDPLTVIQILGQ